MGQSDLFRSYGVENEYLMIGKWVDEFPWLVAGFTTRKAGQSHAPFDSMNCGLHVGDDPTLVIKNRKQLSTFHGFSFKNWVSANQTHGSSLYQVSIKDGGMGSESLETAIQDTDAIYTDEKNIFLASFYADCVPLYFLDPINRLIGIAHAGWKGTAAHIGPKLASCWQENWGTSLSELRVVIGPSIGGCCYEVDSNITKHFIDQSQPTFSKECILPLSKGKFSLDLKQINYELLLQAGIKKENIELAKYCTSCRVDLFFSHRKEKGKTGRMAAFMGMKEEEVG
jgi:YfiH family protein